MHRVHMSVQWHRLGRIAIRPYHGYRVLCVKIYIDGLVGAGPRRALGYWTDFLFTQEGENISEYTVLRRCRENIIHNCNYNATLIRVQQKLPK